MYIVRYFELNSTFHNLTSQIFNILCNQDSIQWLTQFVVYLHWPRTEAINSEYPWKLFSSPTEIRTRNSRMKIWRHNPLTIGPFIWWIQREVSHYPTLLQLERVIGIEPTSRPWKGHILTVVLYSHKQNTLYIHQLQIANYKITLLYVFFFVLREQESNLRSSGYEPDELPLLHPTI